MGGQFDYTNILGSFLGFVVALIVSFIFWVWFICFALIQISGEDDDEFKIKRFRITIVTICLLIVEFWVIGLLEGKVEILQTIREKQYDMGIYNKIEAFIMFIQLFDVYAVITAILCNYKLLIITLIADIAYYLLINGHVKMEQLKNQKMLNEEQNKWQRSNKREGTFTEKRSAILNEEKNNNDEDIKTPGMISTLIESGRDNVRKEEEEKARRKEAEYQNLRRELMVDTLVTQDFARLTPEQLMARQKIIEQDMIIEQEKREKARIDAAKNRGINPIQQQKWDAMMNKGKEDELPDFSSMSREELIKYAKEHSPGSSEK